MASFSGRKVSGIALGKDLFQRSIKIKKMLLGQFFLFLSVFYLK